MQVIHPTQEAVAKAHIIQAYTDTSMVIWLVICGLAGRDGSEVRQTGRTTDVLRRQEDGVWRLVIDNPWGTTILG